MALDDYVSVLIIFANHIKDSTYYPALIHGLEQASPPEKPPHYHAYNISTVATAQLPRYVIGILQGHTLIRRVCENRVPARDYESINSKLHFILRQWDEQFGEEEKRGDKRFF